jgi:hypothetical protein
MIFDNDIRQGREDWIVYLDLGHCVFYSRRYQMLKISITFSKTFDHMF